MTRFLACGCLLLLSAFSAGPAQALEPFIANYQVLRGGRVLGEATMQVAPTGNDRWRVDLTMRGTGLAGLAGINAEQSTVFDTVGETYRPLTQATLQKSLFTRRQTVGIYDWASHTGRWSGDIKKKHAAPLSLRDGDMSGLLINLAVIRDAQPGTSLHYRFVDNGRVRDHEYTVAPQLEDVTIADVSYSAMRVDRVLSGDEEASIWVVAGVPTPVRMLQREGGQDTYDLRLTDYKGVTR